MLWTDLFYMIVITTFTGSVLTVAWLITSYLLDKTGYLNMSYRLGKVVVLFWIIPVMYYAIRMIDRLRFVWNGYAFDTSPLIINVTRAVAIVWITGLAVAIMIYVYSDTTILGFMATDYEVGIYSVSVKVYNIIKNLLSSTKITYSFAKFETIFSIV